MTGPHPAIVALGSNLGARREHLEHAVTALGAAPEIRVLAVSSFVETRPVGGPPGQGSYLNAVARLETTLEPRALLERLLAIEAERGRDRLLEPRWGPRTLDLDLIFYGSVVLEEPDLILPHPRAEEREFVLRPLAELEPARVLPRCGRTVVERLAELEGA